MALLKRRPRASHVQMARIAGGIEDPVLRLRFLKTAMPRSPAAARLRFYWILLGGSPADDPGLVFGAARGRLAGAGENAGGPA